MTAAYVGHNSDRSILWIGPVPWSTCRWFAVIRASVTRLSAGGVRGRTREGLTVGLVDNGKPNSTMLLTTVAKELQRAHGLRTWVIFNKSYFGTPVEESLIQQILNNCDFAVAAIGD